MIIPISVFGCLAVCCSVAGFVFNASLKTGSSKAQCATVALIDDFAEGTTVDANVWLGISPAIPQLSNIQSKFKTVISSMKANTNMQTVNTDAKAKFDKQLDDLYAAYANPYYNSIDAAANCLPKNQNSFYLQNVLI